MIVPSTGGGEKLSEMEAQYKLKPMVVLRLLAEVTAFCILGSLPLWLWLRGEFFSVSATMRVLSIIGTVGALVILPAYGFVTYKVITDAQGLATASLFKRQAARWEQMKSLKLKTSWGWRRYIIKLADESQLMFPVWLQNLGQLCADIRTRLPASGGAGGGIAAPKVFSLAASMVAVQLGQLAMAGLFVFLMWQFSLTAPSLAKHPDDRTFMLGACGVLSAALVVRWLAILLTARRLVTDGGGIEATTWLFKCNYQWQQITNVAPTFFLLPEGLLLQAGKSGFVLLAEQMDAFDELQEEIRKRVPPKPVPQNPPAKNL